jgi:hypothetical protein
MRRRRLVGFGPGLEGLEDRTVLSFFAPPTYAVGLGPQAEAVGDFNGDGQADMVVVNRGSNSVSVLQGSGDGTFLPAFSYATGVSPSAVAAGDFNGDGHLDLAGVTPNLLAPSQTIGIQVWLNNGNGTFPIRSLISAAGVILSSQATADFNGDGIPVLVHLHDHGSA